MTKFICPGRAGPVFRHDPSFLITFLFILCGRLSCLSLSIILHVEYTVSCRIISNFVVSLHNGWILILKQTGRPEAESGVDGAEISDFGVWLIVYYEQVSIRFM